MPMNGWVGVAALCCFVCSCRQVVISSFRAKARLLRKLSLHSPTFCDVLPHAVLCCTPCSEAEGKMSSPGFQAKIRANAQKFEFQAEVGGRL